MSTERQKTLGKQFRAAGSSGTKAHVMYSTGKWIFFMERARKATAAFVTKRSAVNAAMKWLDSGKAEALVIHKKDGSVSQVRVS